MAYDFDKITDRSGTFCIKWDAAGDALPMWVADMDFKTAPEIIEALNERAAHGIYGYTDLPDEWRMAYVNWWKNRREKNAEIEQKNAEIEAQKTFEEAKNNADFIIAEAKKNAKTIEEKSAEEIKSQKENMIHSSKNEIAELAVNIAEKILERETNEEDTKRIINEFFDEANI